MSAFSTPDIAEDLWAPLSRQVERMLQGGRPCLICIAGNSGCGKSLLGKMLRKRGIATARPREMVVIDDGVASVTFAGIFRRRVSFQSKEKDHLVPFLPYMRGKKVVVYVNSQPTRRIDACDLLIELRCAEPLRRRHLSGRNVDGDKRAADTAGYRLVEPKTKARFVVENDGVAFRLRASDHPLAC